MLTICSHTTEVTTKGNVISAHRGVQARVLLRPGPKSVVLLPTNARGQWVGEEEASLRIILPLSIVFRLPCPAAG